MEFYFYFQLQSLGYLPGTSLFEEKDKAWGSTWQISKDC